MSEFIRGKRNFSVFDSLSTEELKEILRQDSQSSSSKCDIDAILYILEVLEKREKDKSDLEYEAKVALESFKENYLPFADDPEPLYYDEENGINIDDDGVEVIPFTERAEVYPEKEIRNLKTTKVILIAAVIAIIVGSVSAQALGFDIWKRVAQWSKETFGFFTQTEQYPKQNMERSLPPQLKEMADCMAKYGISSDVLPTYIPEEYSLGKFMCSEGSSSTTFIITFSEHDNDGIQLLYTLYSNNDDNLDLGRSEFQKIDDYIEMIEISSVSYYIMINNGKYCCSWYTDSLEGYIFGLNSKDDLLDIIYSINGV